MRFKQFFVRTGFIASVLLTSPLARASLEGLSTDLLDSLEISGVSRPCCSFGNDPISVFMGFSKLIGAGELGTHSFAARAEHGQSPRGENYGITFTCKAGFVDIAHLRDNLDWTAHVYYLLKKEPGAKKTFILDRELGSKKTITFNGIPKVELEKMTDRDFALIAQQITYELSVWHEILTSLGLGSENPIVRERCSAFSVEDNYSNFLGTQLGVEAVLDPRPFDVAATDLIAKKLEEFQAKPYSITKQAFARLENKWWKQTAVPTADMVLKRDTHPLGNGHGYLVPSIHPEKENFGCGKNAEAITQKIPTRLSTGKKIHRFYSIDFEPSTLLNYTLDHKTGFTFKNLKLKDFIWLINLSRDEIKGYSKKFKIGDTLADLSWLYDLTRSEAEDLFK